MPGHQVLLVGKCLGFLGSEWRSGKDERKPPNKYLLVNGEAREVYSLRAKGLRQKGWMGKNLPQLSHITD